MVYIMLSMKYLSKILLVAIIAMSLTTVQARPNKHKDKPDKPRPEKKVDREKVKERLKAAAEKRKKQRGTKKPKHFGRWDGKRIQSEELNELREKMRELTKELHELRKKHAEEMKKRMAEIKKEFANKRDKVIEGNKPGE